MTKQLTLNIWGREFTLPIEYDCHTGETVTQQQTSAVKRFASHKDWIADAKEQVEDFCKASVTEDDNNNKKDNIFSYVKPHYLFVKRDEKNPRVALMCKYRYDPEHGLAVVFASDGAATVGIQDIIL